MIVFWTVCAILTIAAAMLILRPLARNEAAGSDTIAPDIAVYQDQLAEIQRDGDRGLLTEVEAESARIEVSRRLLASDSGRNAHPGSDRTSRPDQVRRATFYAIAGFLVLLPMTLYLAIGAPGYGGIPHAERAARAVANAPVNELVARVEARLREQPNDAAGWDVIAPVYLRLRRFDDAIVAFRQAIALRGEDARRLSGLAEAWLARNNGIVGEEARTAFKKLLAINPKLVSPRFWLAVGLEQEGKKDEAKRAYLALFNDETPSGGFPPPLKQLVAQRLKVLGVTNLPSLPKSAGSPPRMGTAGASGKAPELSSEARRQAQQLSPADQAAMIEGMVEGLAQRVKANGGTLQEWKRLIRAYVVLGRRVAATKAYGNAKENLKSDSAALKELEEFAQRFGLKAAE